jgi:hypothetical protein
VKVFLLIGDICLEKYNQGLVNRSGQVKYGFDSVGLGQVGSGKKFIGLKWMLFLLHILYFFVRGFEQVNGFKSNFVMFTRPKGYN